METEFLIQSSMWGRIFEIAVQRGVLANLLHQQLLTSAHPSLQDWNRLKIAEIHKRVIRTLNITDPNAREWMDSSIRHLLVYGYGLGWSTIRECLKRNAPRAPRIEALWCPLTLPDASQPSDEENEAIARAFHSAFGLAGHPDLGLLAKGHPGRADFLLWLKSAKPSKNKAKYPDNLILCFEYSCNAPPKIADYRTEEPHCEEVHRYARYIESRGVFARVCAEVEGANIVLSEQISKHLMAFSGIDKPLYKLCQASSYAERVVELLQKKQRLQEPCDTRALAVTSNGLECLAAHFDPGTELDSRALLMQSLGKAYRTSRKLADDAPDDLRHEIRLVFNKLLRSLPTEFKEQAKQLKDTPNLGENQSFLLTERVKEFYRPTSLISSEAVINAQEHTPELDEYFGNQGRTCLDSALKTLATSRGELSLRNAHAAVVIAGLSAAQRGRLNVIALEGNPGIGKTTAITNYLLQHQEGYCLFYVSPRVVINRDVSSKLARDSNEQERGILTLTSNSKLISLAPQWYEQQAELYPDKRQKIDSAVVVDGISNLKHPPCSTLFITPKIEQEIDTNVVVSSRYKQSRNEREDSVKAKARPGVFRTLATSARKLLEANPTVNRLVITAAIQGYRSSQQTTTIDSLSGIFSKKPDTLPGKQERRDFAQKIPTIIAMVDEVAGDGAGALFCHRLADWLTQQFIAPFEGEVCPFRVILILSDASLSNEVVLNSYLNSDERAPDKILISPTQGNVALRVTGTRMKVGLHKYPTLHVMTNSYPATALKIDYSIRLSRIRPVLESNGQHQSIRNAIRVQAEDELLRNAQVEIERGLTQGAEQIIFFAQNKAFLRQLRKKLIDGSVENLTLDQVKVLDQTVPEAQRLELVREPIRDQVKVFLMTSSGARGVSFPKTDWIIASIPRFNTESSLMEIAQLIYRGRGSYSDAISGEKVSGDDKARQLVMLINDFLVAEDSTERDRQWLRQSSDLLTLLLMLRSTILTRIKGDAGLRRQRIAFVPVGFVGDEELLTLMSDDLADFIKESKVSYYDDYSPQESGLIVKAMKLAEELFADFQLRGFSKDSSPSTFADFGLIESFAKTVSRPSSSLLPGLQEASLIIPETISCFGPYWLEDWQSRSSEEKFNFETWRSDVKSGTEELRKLLYRISEHSHFPPKLRRPAKELLRLLPYEKEISVREASTLQDMRTENFAVALPLDYPHFWGKHLKDGQIQPEIEDPESWKNALGTALTSHGLVMPVVPRYKDFPWAAVAGHKQMSQIEKAFDSRYFMVSSELNLLNTILLEDMNDFPIDESDSPAPES